MALRDDDLLAGRIADGEDKAADEFERIYRPRLIRCAEANRVPDGYSEDIVQEVLLSAIVQIRDRKFRGDSQLGTWLRRILLNKIADHWRESEREGRTVAPPHPARCPIEAVAVPGFLSKVDERLDLERLLSSLPSIHRAILLMNESEGWTIDEIAAKLGMRPGTVGRKLKEAKDMLRRRVAESTHLVNQRGLLCRPAKNLKAESD